MSVDMKSSRLLALVLAWNKKDKNKDTICVNMHSFCDFKAQLLELLKKNAFGLHVV